MGSDLKIEIFAYNWFHRALNEHLIWLPECDATEVYKDECLALPDIMEASNCEDLYEAINCRRVFFRNLYFNEIDAQVHEFEKSQMDFYYYIIRTCNRVDLFGHLTIFELVLATSAFVCCLCSYCFRNSMTEVMKCGYLCWAMYFDKYIDEFYVRGGWTGLKIAATSYRVPFKFLAITGFRESAHIGPIKIRKAIKDYQRFKEVGEIDHDESISVSWVKYYAQNINRSSANDFGYFTEASHREAEDFMKQLKYLCDPIGSEIFQTLLRMTSSTSLETFMANMNIYNEPGNLQSEADGILAPNLKQTPTVVKLSSKSAENRNIEDEDVLTCKEDSESSSPFLDSSSKLDSRTKIGHVSDADPTKTEFFQLQSQEQNTEATIIENLFENLTISNNEGKNDLNKNTILTSQLSSTGKNMEKEDDGITCETRKEEKQWKTKNSENNTILGRQMHTTENMDAKIDNNKILNGLRKQQGEGKVIKGAIRSMNLIEQIPLAKKNATKENDKETQDGTRKEQEENSNKTQDGTRKELEENFNKIEDGSKKEQEEKRYKIQNDAKEEREESSNKSQDGSKKELEEWKGIGQVSFLTDGTNAEEENNKIEGTTSQKKKNKKTGKKRKEKSTVPVVETINNEKEENKEKRNSLREEQRDGDIKNFLRLFLVLGDKQGNSYVRKTS